MSNLWSSRLLPNGAIPTELKENGIFCFDRPNHCAFKYEFNPISKNFKCDNILQNNFTYSCFIWFERSNVYNLTLKTYTFFDIEFTSGDSSGVEAELLLCWTDLSLSGGVIGEEKDRRIFFTGESDEKESEERLFTAVWPSKITVHDDNTWCQK